MYKFLTNSPYAFPAIILALMLGFLLLLIGFRLWITYKMRRDQASRDQWATLFARAAHGDEDQKPGVASNQEQVVLSLWHRMMNLVQGPAGERLISYGEDIDLVEIARGYVHHRSGQLRVLAISVLGQLKDSSSWAEIRKEVDNPAPYFSLVAASALLSIDEERALPIFLRRLKDDPNWPRPYVARVLRTVSGDGLRDPFLQMIDEVDAGKKQVLIPLFQLLPPDDAVGPLLDLLQETDEREVRASCLKELGNTGHEKARESVRKYLDHDVSFIRIQAVCALGQIGTIDDAENLYELLGDREWWVRYRTAEALIHILGYDNDRLQEISETHPDPYARDIMQNVLGEQGLLEVRV